MNVQLYVMYNSTFMYVHVSLGPGASEKKWFYVKTHT